MKSWEEYVLMARILIKNGRVWDGEQFSYADVLTDGAQIARVEPGLKEDAEFVYDAEGNIVSAGLVDAHMHMRGLNEQYGIHAELSSIPFGVTAAADAGGVMGSKALLDSFLLKNVVFVQAVIRGNEACFDLAEKMLKEYGERTVGIKVYFDTTNKELKDAKPLCEIVEYAKKKGLMVMVHSSNPPVPMPELLSILRKGDIVTHAYHGGKNNVSEDGYECIQEAKSRGVIIDAGLAGHVHTDFKVFQDAIRCGAIPDVISTDITKLSAYVRGGRYGMTMCMNISRTLGMCEEEIFRAVTSNPAKALGKESEWGYLKVGRAADIAVFDYTNEGFDLTDRAGNHICNTMGWRCALTVSDGQVVYRN